MSYSFYIPTDYPNTFSELFAAFPRLSIEGEEIPSDDRFALDYYYHVYEDFVSVRSLELGLGSSEGGDSKSVFSVRIMTAASIEDYKLALDITLYIAGLAGAKIQGEDSDALDLDALEAHFDNDWIERMSQSGPTALRSMLKSGDYAGPFELSGTRRPFYFGMQSLTRIDSEDEATFVENYFELARRVQYIDDNESVFAATKMQMRNEDPEKACIFSVWGPGVDYLFPDVDFVSVLSEDILIIPIGVLDVFTKVEFIDDRHRTAEKVDDDKWDAVIERARALKIDPTNPPQRENI